MNHITSRPRHDSKTNFPPAGTSVVALTLIMATNLRESYELLGLPTNATEEEVRKAYKQKARECHPDKNPDDPLATEKFQALRQGYERIVSSEEPDEDEEYFSGFHNFFHFVIMREMMRRRMREQMMARMFQGIFEDDSDFDDADGFLFGRPFFHQRSRHRESSSRSHNFRFRDQEDTQNERSSYERGSSAKPPKKKKERKKNLRKSYTDCNGNSDGAEQTQRQSSSKQEATFDSDDDFTTNYNYGRADFNGERETCGGERAKPNMFSKSKQRNKNKSQMTASEWQKGRKPKKHHKKKQSAKSSNSPSASVEKSAWDSRSRNSNGRQDEEEHCCSSATTSPNSKYAEGKRKLNSGQFGREMNAMEYDEKVKDTYTSERGKPGDSSSETIPESLKGEKDGARGDTV